MSVMVTGLGPLIERLATAAEALRAHPLAATVGSDVLYSGFVEKGTRSMSAWPYLAPAEERNIAAVEESVAEGLVEMLETGNPTAIQDHFHAGVLLIEQVAESIVRVRTGTLRGSIHTDFLS